MIFVLYCATVAALQQSLEDRLTRLGRIADADGGFFVLALHAFVEAFIREDAPALRAVESFHDLLWAYRDRLAARGRTAEELSTLTAIIREHTIAVQVMESFLRLDPEEVRAATHNFLRFCSMCGVESPRLRELEATLSAWEEKHPAEQGDDELSAIQTELVYTQEDTKRLLAQSAQWAADKQRLAELDGDTMRLSAEIEKERARGDIAAPRIAALQKELDALVPRKRAIAEQLATYRDLDQYVAWVSRFSHYTRTRRDYERGVMKLTAEQQEALDGLRPGRDALIRGGAGTGKTIVLLHALERIRRERTTELALNPASRILFLTYTTTLVKFDRYVAEILRNNEAEDLIITADSFFQARLRLLGKRQRVDYGIVQKLAESLNSTSFFTPAELTMEIEDFLFGNLVTREEYVEQKIARRGMRQPLSAGQREEVWDIREKMVASMLHDGVLSKNYSRIALIEHLEAHPDDAALRDLDVALIDESQDLSAADLRALRLMTRRGLIMAGDTGQSIYGVSSPYRRAGIDVTGRTRVLHTSFRNTVAIQQVAESYRALSGIEDDEAAGTVAFRRGPIPELYTAATRQELVGLLLRKAALFIERLGYDPENVTILAPTKGDLATIGDALGHAGYYWANIHDEDFSFRQAKTIRLSTLHSSKGLDFAVVLLYVPALAARVDIEDRAASLQARNLLYVAMTRAMDNLNVFTLEGEHEGQREEPLQDLVKVIR
ncbi:MAG TPA: UvrD-helicase domain-containing protein, partial [Spirochaetia bacterium]